jgi:O-antigen ligase
MLGTIAWWGTLLVILLGANQYSFEIARRTYISAVDPLIWIVFGLLFWRAACRRDVGDLRRPPCLSLAFLAFVAISAINAGSRAATAKDLFQFAEYFVAAFMLFEWSAGSEPRRRRMLDVFLWTGTVIVAVGVGQYAMPSVDDFVVRGTFGNRNVFGGFLALLLPLMFGILLCTPSWPRRAWLLAVVAAGLLVTLSGGTWIALLCGLGTVSMLKHRGAFLVTAVCVVVAGIFVLPHLPRANSEVLHDSVALYDADGQVTTRYPEWQAAAVMLQENALFGVGGGNYQANIGRYYGVIPSPPGKAEPDSQNLYLVLGSSLGLPGLAAFAGMLLLFGCAAGRAALRAGPSPWRGAALGLTGSFVAFAVNAVWSPLLVRGIGVPLALLGALAVVIERMPAQDQAG